ncbi:MAG: phosphoglycerate dehydrogenase [Verrucomicrobiales bacterium]|nr:phosphoglycerate dehydrogenase [Verrucomicrobiales bacterium]
MATRKVLIADPISQKGIDELAAESGLEVDNRPEIGGMEDKDEQEVVLRDIITDYHGLIVRSGAKVRPSVIEAATNLRAIGRAGVGVDNIDIAAATKQGVVVMNTPTGNTISTAEHAFTLMTALARHIPQAHISVMENRFKEGRKAYKGVELYKKTLAILGMGRIGSEFARRAMGFGMRVVVYDPYLAASKAKSLRVELCDTVDEAVEQADFITLHMPKTPETAHLINADRIAKMKDGVRIVNCARGGLIDEEAALAGLESGKIAGLALDVFEEEPPPADHPFLQREDVVMTPHLGASTEEAQENVGIDIARAIRDRLLNGIVVNAVNMPNIDEQTLAEIGPYLNLAEVLGKAAAQIAPKQPDFFRINYSGKVSDIDTTLVTRSALKGFFEASAGAGSANYLNAQTLAEDHGIRVSESRPAELADFAELIEVEVGNDDEQTSVAASFFGNLPRIVKIRDRNVEADTKGHLLLVENSDEPGVIGNVGRILGEAKINIASMSLSRNQVGGRALSVLNLDSEISDEILAALEATDGIHEARVISL